MVKLKIGQVGIGGFGRQHLNNIKILSGEGRISLEAICDRDLENNSKNLEEFGFQEVHKYTDFEEFLSKEKELDLILICTPIPLHKSMACRTMECGYNVLLEKPPAVTIQDIDEIIATQKSTGKACIVGFQMTSAKNFLKFKEKLSENIIGNIKLITGVGMWHRSNGYFTRSPWVGRLLYNGNYVLDGPMNNALSHVLNNCLLLAGLGDYTDSIPEWVQSELYRSNEIESEDTSCVRIKTKGGAEVYFYSTLCARSNYSPYIWVKGSKGEAFWNYDGSILFRNINGEIILEDKLASDASIDHLNNTIDFLQGKSNQMPCPVEAIRSFVLAGNLAFESSVETHKVPEKYLSCFNKNEESIDKLSDQADFLYLKGIEEMISQASTKSMLFSEMGIDWAVAGKPVESAGYHCFNMFK